jgi:hypothetical protein
VLITLTGKESGVWVCRFFPNPMCFSMAHVDD